MSVALKDKEQLNKCWAFLLCLLPILDPYLIGIGELMIVECVAVAVAFYALVNNRIALNKSFLALLFGFFILSIISALPNDHRNTSTILQVKVLIFQMLNMVAFGFLWIKVKKENFLDAVVAVGVIAASLAIIQFVAASIGFRNFYDGRLPFAVSSNNYFGGLFDRNTGDLRVHSFFEEPSYLALFEMPVLAYCLRNKKIKSAIIVGASCLLTGSLLGAVGVVVVMLYTLLMDSSMKMGQRLLAYFIVFALVIAGIVLYTYNDAVRGVFDYLIRRFTNMETELDSSNSSVSVRLIGNVKYFSKYGLLNKLVGVGFNQYAVYFDLPKNYSNDFVTTLLDFGIIGVIILVITLISLYSKIDKEGKVYFIIFVMALAVDHIWFNTYFFYLLSWCIFNQKDKDIIRLSFSKV